MTAALGNTAQGTPFATGVDSFVYPQVIFNAMRAPTTQDVYNGGTRWIDNSVNPKVLYETTGAGNWSAANTSGSFTNLTANGTVNINTSGAGVTTIGTGGTGATNIGNATGNTAVTGTLTTSGAITATTGNITAAAGNLVATLGNLNLNGVSSKVNVSVAAPATASAGTTAALTAGAIVVATTAITASSLVFFATNTLGTVTVPQAYRVSARTPGVSFTIQSQDATDTSTVNYWIIN